MLYEVITGTTNNVYGRRNLLAHLKTKLLSMNDEIVVMSGHGPPSTVGAERLFNAELMEAASVKEI